MEADAATGGRRRPKWGTLALVLLAHVLIIAGLARAFAPDFTTTVVRDAISVFTVTITAPEEEPPPPPPVEPVPDEGTSGEQGRKATPRENAAPPTRLPLNPTPAPRTPSTGAAVESGASASGDGTGGASAGDGTGSGQSGVGQGSGGARKLAKLEGDINSARDYPKKTRDLRIGHSVTIVLTVGTDGRVRDCRVSEPSPDSEADAITCRLASERFRFEPALNARGEAVEGRYSWRQRWFY